MVAQEDAPAAGPPHAGLPAPGTVFAGHVVESVVGRGGMGVVYRARHCGLDRVVALKVIVPERLEHASTHRRFREEAVTAASVEHPNVVPVYDAGEFRGVAYMVMRFVHGMDLHAMVREAGPLEPARAAEIVAKVGDALDAMHRAGYVHRDVKPRNVLIAQNGHVYLSDFGLCRRIACRSGHTRLGDWVGTADYAAPEQIAGRRTEARSDVYGLGGVLYFALTGRPPYDRDNEAAKLWAHICEPAPLPSRLQSRLPAAMDAAVARALAKDPADRFPSAGELGRAALLAARGARPQNVARPPRPRVKHASGSEAPTVASAAVAPAAPAARRPRARVGAGAAVLAAVGGARALRAGHGRFAA